MEKEQSSQRENLARDPIQNHLNSLRNIDLFAFLKADEEHSRPTSASFFSKNGLSRDIIQVTEAEPDICLEVFYALYNVLWPQIEKQFDASLKDAWISFIGTAVMKGSLCPPEGLIRERNLRAIKITLSQPGGEDQIFQELDQVVRLILNLKQKVIDCPGELLQKQEIIASLKLVEEFYRDYRNQLQTLVQTIIEKEEMHATSMPEHHKLETLLEPRAVMTGDAFNHHWAYRISRTQAQRLLCLRSNGGRIASPFYPVIALPENIPEPLVYFKANGHLPIQPEKDFMVESLYRHLHIPVPETALLILTNVFERNPDHFYAVRASEAVNGEDASQACRKQETILEEKAYIQQVIGALLTNPRDNSSRNFKYCPRYKTLIRIDNDWIFEPELIRNYDREVVNVKSILYLLPQIDLGIPESIRILFTTLDPSLTISSWLRDLSRKNQEYTLLFARLAFQKTRCIYQNLQIQDETPLLAECLEQKILVDPGLYEDSFRPQIFVSEKLLNHVAEKLQLIGAVLLNKREVSGQALFEEISPLLGKYYSRLRLKFNDLEDAVEALWGDRKNGVDYSNIASLLDYHEYDDFLDKNKEIVEDEKLSPEMFVDKYKYELLSGEILPLDNFIQRHSQRKIKNALHLDQALKELQFLIQEGFIGSQSPRDIVDFCYSITDIDDQLKTEIISLLSNLPIAELKWLFTLEKHFCREDCDVPEDLRAFSIPIVGAFVERRTFLLTESERGYLFGNRGSLIRSASLTGRSLISFFPKENPEFFLKQYPQYPVYELASNLFMRMLGIQHLPYQELVVIDLKYPVLVTQKVSGTPLDRVWRDPEAFHQLEPFHTGLLIISTMLLSPEEHKEDDFFLSEDGRYLIPIGNSRYFLPSSFQRPNFGNNSHVIPQMRSILFCLDQMGMRIPLEVKQHILSINFDALLTSWMNEVVKVEERFCHLVDQYHHNSFLHHQDTLMRITFFKQFIHDLHWKVSTIQKTLKKKDDLTLFDLLKDVQPETGRRYNGLYDPKKSLQNRAVTNKGYSVPGKVETSPLRTMTSFLEEKDAGPRIGPLDSLELLNQLIGKHSKDDKKTGIEKDLLCELDDQKKEALLIELFGNPLLETTLGDFWLEPKEGLIFKGNKLMKISRNLQLRRRLLDKGRTIRFLSLTDNPFLTLEEIRILSQECPNLEYLNVSGCEKLNSIITPSGGWPYLARIEAKKCLNLEKFVCYSPIQILEIETDRRIQIFMEKSSLDVFIFSKRAEKFSMKIMNGDIVAVEFQSQQMSNDNFLLNLLSEKKELWASFRMTMENYSISSVKDLTVYIKNINLQYTNIKVEEMKRLSKLKLMNLKRLNLSRNNMNGTSYLENLVQGEWPGLTSLNLSGNEICDQGCEILAKGDWPLLEKLNLQETKITSAGVQTIVKNAKWGQLKNLDISENKITDEGLATLCRGSWPLLETINLKNTSVTKRGLFDFLMNLRKNFVNLRVIDFGLSGKKLVHSLLRENWSELEELDLSDAGISNHEVQLLVIKSSWSQLKHLDLSDNYLYDESLELLAQGNFPQLETLNLKKTRVTSAGAEAILNKAKWGQIKHLNLSYNDINDEGLQVLVQGDWPFLETLNLENTGVTKNSMLSFLLHADWPNFKTLLLPKWWNADDVELACLFIRKDLTRVERLELNNLKTDDLAKIEIILSRNKCLKLKYLNISDNEISQVSLLGITECPLLEELHLRNIKLTSDELETILNQANWRQLKHLDISHNKIFVEEGLPGLVLADWHFLETLNLSNTNLQHQGIEAILDISKWRHLKHLDVSQNELFDEGLSTLALVDWPLLESLNISQIKCSSKGIEAFVGQSKWPNLKTLDLSLNKNILGEGSESLASGKWPLLECLNLDSTDIELKAVEILVEKASWPNLQEISLLGNIGISDHKDEIKGLITRKWPNVKLAI